MPPAQKVTGMANWQARHREMSLNSVLIERVQSEKFSDGSPQSRRQSPVPVPPGSLPTSPLFARRVSGGSPVSPFAANAACGSPSFRSVHTMSPIGGGWGNVFPSASGEKKVPEGWEGYFDSNLGITYYHNLELGETVWAVDQGWPEVAPDESSTSAAPSEGRASPSTSASPVQTSPLRRGTLPSADNQSFGMLSADENDDDAAEGWAIAVDRKTGSIFRYCLHTGARRPFIS